MILGSSLELAFNHSVNRRRRLTNYTHTTRTLSDGLCNYISFACKIYSCLLDTAIWTGKRPRLRNKIGDTKTWDCKILNISSSSSILNLRSMHQKGTTSSGSGLQRPDNIVTNGSDKALRPHRVTRAATLVLIIRCATSVTQLVPNFCLHCS